MAGATDPVAAALAGLAAGESRAAREELERQPGDELARALASALAADAAPGGEVYVDPSAFRRFIDSAPNAALYAAVEDRLAAWVAAGDPSWVVDVGCGDGRVTQAVTPPGAAVVELVEPARAMLDVAVGRFAGRRVDAWCRDAETWTAEVLAPDLRRRDAGWATFALHNLPGESRIEVLGRLAAGVDRFAVVEFDVPGFTSTEEHAAYCADRYRRGLAVHDDPLVVAGFLVPVLLGQFAPGAPRHTHEQPLDAWAADLRGAGFADVAVQPVHSGFWWAPAAMVTGSRPVSER